MSTAGDLVREVANLINDAESGYEHIRWTPAELLEYANDAVIQVAVLRPDLFAKQSEIDLKAGARQELPPGSIRFYRVEGIVDAMGRLVGQPLRTDLRAVRIAGNWFSEPACGDVGNGYQIRSFQYDEDDPTVFYVAPPVPPGRSVKAVVTSAKTPEKFGADDVPPLDRRFHNAVVEWMLYRAFGKDLDSAPDDARAAGHLRHFYEILGLSRRADDRFYKKKGAESAPAN